jgi:hypothetical protein
LELRRAAVATYLQTFILIGAVLGGAFLVFRVSETYSNSLDGPGLSISDFSIRQGTNAGVESFVISNVGQVSFASVTIVDPSLSTAASYCYTLWDPTTMSSIANTCPNLASNPTTIMISAPIPPGSSSLLTLTLPGAGVFLTGVSYPIIVLAPDGVQASADPVASAG